MRSASDLRPMPNQGALAEPELDHRSVYRFDPQIGELHRMADFEQPNGLAFTADGTTLYVSDTSLSLGEVPGHQAGTKARDHRIRRRRRRHALEPALLLPHRSWLSRRFRGRCARLGVDERGGWRAHLVGRPPQARASCPTPAVVSELHLRGLETDGDLFIAATQYLLAIDLIG